MPDPPLSWTVRVLITTLTLAIVRSHSIIFSPNNNRCTLAITLLIEKALLPSRNRGHKRLSPIHILAMTLTIISINNNLNLNHDFNAENGYTPSWWYP